MKTNRHEYVFFMFTEMFGDGLFDLSGIEWHPAGKNTISITTDSLNGSKVLFTYVDEDVNALMTEGYYIAKLKGEV